MFEIIEEQTELPGYLFRPNRLGPSPGLVFLHGSGGGSNNFWTDPNEPPRPTGKEAIVVRQAMAFARKGYATLALSYFDSPCSKNQIVSPPDELVRVDIKKITERALAHVRALEFVDERSVGVCGASRGAEHALVFASLVQKGASGAPDYVLSFSPIAYICGGISKEMAQAISRGEQYSGPDLPSWVYDGVELKIGEHIDFKQIDVPFLITAFDEDPVWQTQHDIETIKAFLMEQGVDFEYCDMSLSIEEKRALFIKRGQNLLVRMAGEGHCFPMPHIHPDLMEGLRKLAYDFADVHSKTARSN